MSTSEINEIEELVRELMDLAPTGVLGTEDGELSFLDGFTSLI